MFRATRRPSSGAQTLTHISLLQYVKPEAAIAGFKLLMMGGVSPGTCSAIKKH
jgi:hypothetical protein